MAFLYFVFILLTINTTQMPLAFHKPISFSPLIKIVIIVYCPRNALKPCLTPQDKSFVAKVYDFVLFLSSFDLRFCFLFWKFYILVGLDYVSSWIHFMASNSPNSFIHLVVKRVYLGSCRFACLIMKVDN